MVNPEAYGLIVLGIFLFVLIFVFGRYEWRRRQAEQLRSTAIAETDDDDMYDTDDDDSYSIDIQSNDNKVETAIREQTPSI